MIVRLKLCVDAKVNKDFYGPLLGIELTYLVNRVKREPKILAKLRVHSKEGWILVPDYSSWVWCPSQRVKTLYPKGNPNPWSNLVKNNTLDPMVMVD